MARQEPVGSIRRPYNSSSRDEDRTECIQCVDGREPQINEFLTFSKYNVMCEDHPTAQVDVSSGFVREFATHYLTPSCRGIPIFGVNSNNGSIQWFGVPDFLRTDGPPWTANLLAPHSSWGY